MKLEEIIDKGLWVLATMPGMRYLGRVISIGNRTADVTKDNVLHKSAGQYLGLFPVVEHMVQVLPMDGGLRKVPMDLPVDMTAHETTIYIVPSSLMFLDDMKEEDQKSYRAYMREGVRNMQNSHLESSLAKPSDEDIASVRRSR